MAYPGRAATGIAIERTPGPCGGALSTDLDRQRGIGNWLSSLNGLRVQSSKLVQAVLRILRKIEARVCRTQFLVAGIATSLRLYCEEPSQTKARH